MSNHTSSKLWCEIIYPCQNIKVNPCLWNGPCLHVRLAFLIPISSDELVLSLPWRHWGTIASHITSLTIVYSTVYAGADQSKHQSSASLAFVWGIHRGPGNSPYKWPVTRKMFPFDDVIMFYSVAVQYYLSNYERLAPGITSVCVLPAKYLDDVNQWRERPKASDAEFWCFLWSTLKKWLSKQSRRWWFETPLCSVWRHSNY